VKALLTANAAAPGRQNAAIVAARAASEMFRKPGDETRSEGAAATAHLAMLGGASGNDALAAAHMFAAQLDMASAANELKDAVTMQVAYAQAAAVGSPATFVDGQQMEYFALAAAAASDAFDKHSGS